MICRSGHRILFLASGLISLAAFGQQPQNQVAGNLIQFNDNGAWCWYQDERAVVDTISNKIILGSVASGAGTGGRERNGSVETVIFDLSSMTGIRYPLVQWQEDCDDHNAPAFMIRPDRKYLAMYTRHYDRYCSRYRIFHDTAWDPELQFDWTTIPGGTDYTIAYSNLLYLSSENRVYNFARANHRSPNLIFSDDFGDTWQFGGQLSSNSSHTYNKGYYKYWGNGIDRIDFILTEQHPRDTSTSIYHGFIRNGKSHTSSGKPVDENIFDTLNIPSFRQFTTVFKDSTVISGNAMRRCWICDLVRYDDGKIAAIISARINDNRGGGSAAVDPGHAFIYCQFNDTTWSYSYLCKAGLKMYSAEQDYTGLGALCPDDPNTIYLSTTKDPRNDKTTLGVHEIFKGTTANGGITWTWTPVTWNSKCDNFRPVVPAWNRNHTALLWWRGKYTSAQQYDAAVVGIIYTRGEYTGPRESRIIMRGGVTRFSIVSGGTYDVWVNFRGDPDGESYIQAGLEPGNIRTFRQTSCGQAGHLCQAYLGRVRLPDHGSFEVYTGNENKIVSASFARIQSPDPEQ